MDLNSGPSTTDPYTVPSGQRIYIITSPGVDLVGFDNTGELGGDNFALPEIAHEFGHGAGLNHSWSNDVTWKDVSWAGPGEYDNPWDLMSAASDAGSLAEIGFGFEATTGVVLRGTESLLTHRWREMDSNFQFRAR
jgi:hypothetical protein